MNEQKIENSSNKSRYLWTVSLVAFVAGVLVCGLVVWSVMPSMMIVTHNSKLGFDESVEAIQASILENGWIVSDVIDMNKSISKHGFELEGRVTLIKLCKAQYAKSVLETDRNISVMMPCTFSVWEDKDGQVKVSKMNMSLMASMFGGNVAKVMGGAVASEEKHILAGVLAN